VDISSKCVQFLKLIANLPKRGRISNLPTGRRVYSKARKNLPEASHSSSKLIVKCGIYFVALKMEVLLYQESEVIEMKIRGILIFVLLFSFQSFAQVFWEEIVPYTVNPPTLSVSNDGNVFIVRECSLIRSTDHGESWDSIYFALAGASGFSSAPKGVIYLLTDSLRKSTDEGNSWLTVSSPFNPYAYHEFIFFKTNNAGDIFIQPLYYNFGPTFRSTDEGNSWVPIGFDSTYIMDIIFKDELTIATFYGNYGGLYKSSDNGDTWEIISNAPANLRTLFISKTGKLFAGGASYGTPPGNLFISSDNGNSWETISEFDSIIVRDIDENQLGHIFMATVSWGVIKGVFRSTDDGVSWQHINSGLNHSGTQKLAIDSSGYVYLVAGAPQMLYRSTQSTTSVEVEDVAVNNFSLKQNYPNPFNPVTTIKYELAKKSFVTLTIFDVLGTEIKILVNEEKPAGTYEINWYAEQLPSGIYFYRLQAGSFVETKKMILLR
jgi:photosystem II stability/assembly factor-like uncharacterized protein